MKISAISNYTFSKRLNRKTEQINQDTSVKNKDLINNSYTDNYFYNYEAQQEEDDNYLDLLYEAEQKENEDSMLLCALMAMDQYEAEMSLLDQAQQNLLQYYA